MTARELGRRGEEYVRQALERRGVEILDRNWRCTFGELDLVAGTATHIRFIEVKTRSAGEAAPPREAVTPAKQRRLIRSAACWLQAHQSEQRLCAFDVAEVVLRDGRFRLRYLADAFDAQGED